MVENSKYERLQCAIARQFLDITNDDMVRCIAINRETIQQEDRGKWFPKATSRDHFYMVEIDGDVVEQKRIDDGMIASKNGILRQGSWAGNRPRLLDTIMSKEDKGLNERRQSSVLVRFRTGRVRP